MKTTTLLDGSKARVGDLVEFFGEPDHVVSGRVTKIYRGTTFDGGEKHGNSIILLVKGGDYIAEIPALQAWMANS